MSDCVFCKIISGEYESSKIYEDDGFKLKFSKLTFYIKILFHNTN